MCRAVKAMGYRVVYGCKYNRQRDETGRLLSRRGQTKYSQRHCDIVGPSKRTVEGWISKVGEKGLQMGCATRARSPRTHACRRTLLARLRISGASSDGSAGMENGLL